MDGVYKLAGLLLVLCILPDASGVYAQKTAVGRDSLLQDRADALHSAQRAHLWRVAAWGSANALGGGALVGLRSRSDDPTSWHFGAMSAGWGLVNVGIAAGGLLGTRKGSTERTDILADERRFHDVLLFNLGLNIAYSAVGGTMVGASSQGIDNRGRWRGFGAALILQGLGLFVLDGIAFLQSRRRLSTLLDTGVDVSVQASPRGVRFALRF